MSTANALPDGVYFFLADPRPSQVAFTEAVLTVLESFPNFIPEFWGLEEREKRPYARDSVLNSVARSTEPRLYLQRKSTPVYKCECAHALRLNSVELDVPKIDRAETVAKVFELATRMAESLPPEYGGVQPVWKVGAGTDAFSNACLLTAKELQRYGPRCLCVRTWLGTHMVQLLGRDVLASTNARVVEPSPGIVQVDVADEPWALSFEELERRWRELIAVVQHSGIFGDYAAHPLPKAGPAWKPIPGS